MPEIPAAPPMSNSPEMPDWEIPTVPPIKPMALILPLHPVIADIYPFCLFDKNPTPIVKGAALILPPSPSVTIP